MNLREWRQLRNRTQEWLADATGIDQALISKYENGTAPLPPNARKIERATDGEVTLEDWYPIANKENEKMAAHDRTLLANLGFNDPDKKDPLHDLGCQYIGQAHICDAFGLKTREDEAIVFDTTTRAQFEQPVSKGQNQYKTTIGFLDVVLPVRYAFAPLVKTGRELQFSNEREAREAWAAFVNEGADQRGETRRLWIDGKYVEPPTWVVAEWARDPVNKQWSRTEKIFVEVKIASVGLGDILRQINLYREYVQGSWILAAAFEMSTAMADALREHEIFLVHLGEGFRKWAAEQRALPRATDVPSL